MVTPPDLNQSWPDNYPSSQVLAQQGWSPLPIQTLAFPSFVIASDNDHLASAESVEKMAEKWGSQCLNLGEVGHMNPASGFGHWPDAMSLITQLDDMA